MTKPVIVPQVKYAVERLRMYRTMRGLKVEQLGLEGTKSYWSDFENLRNEPRMSTIVRYCDALGIPLDVLMKGCPESDGTSRIPPPADLVEEATVWLDLKATDVPKIEAEIDGWERLWLLICVVRNNSDLQVDLKAWHVSTVEDILTAKRRLQAAKDRIKSSLGLDGLSGYAFVLGKAGFVFKDKVSAMAQVEKLKTVKSYANGTNPIPKIVRVKDFESWANGLGVSRIIGNGQGFTIPTFVMTLKAAFAN